MEIQKVINPKDYEVGVIIARLQVNRLHEGQRNMINFVTENHKKVILFLGISKGVATKRNPLDFATRKAMVQKHYPEIVILPLEDQRDDTLWSKTLDKEIKKPFGTRKTLLYGSRDSFIPYYNGRYPTTELVTNVEFSGTQIREEISKEILSSSNFRAGIIHSVYAKFPQVYPTVDVCAYNGDGEILLARKPGEHAYRFIGGFVDPKDVNLEQAGYREFMEETGMCHINKLKYILSQKVDDWRYRSEEDGIMTTLFLGSFGHGQVKATDDVEELKWFPVSYFTRASNIKKDIMEEHQDMMTKLVEKIYQENLVPNLGEFYKPPTIKVDPERVVKDSEFIPK